MMRKEKIQKIKAALKIFFLGILLLIIAFVLYFPLFVFSVVYTIVVLLIRRSFLNAMMEFGLYTLAMAQSIDQTGNVTIQYPANDILIDSNKGYPFGNADQDISGVLGKNKELDTNKEGGELLSAFLNCLDPNHVEDAANHPSNN